MTDGNTYAINKHLDELEGEMITEREWQATVANIEELKAELHLMKTAGIVEVAIRNPNVSEYMAHWERRAEGAEAKLAKALEDLQQLVIEYDEVFLAHDEPPSLTAAVNAARTTLAKLKGQDDE